MTNFFSNLATQLKQAPKQIITGDTLRDWQHASDIFVSNNYELAPRVAFSYHVTFDINPAVLASPWGTEMAQELKEFSNLSLLVKDVTWPSMEFSIKKLNAYNRPHYIQTKATHQAVILGLHDDNASLAQKFITFYQAYYYRDTVTLNGSQQGALGGPTGDAAQNAMRYHNEITTPRQGSSQWGYTTAYPPANSSGELVPLLSSITIYSMALKKNQGVVLLNPVINRIQGGKYAYSESTSTVGIELTLDYEGISTFISTGNDVIPNFGQNSSHYDKGPSPLTPQGGGSKSILGQGGAIDSASAVFSQFKEGNYLGGLFTAARAGNTLKSANFSAMAGNEAFGLIGQAISSAGKNNPASISVPVVPSTTTTP